MEKTSSSIMKKRTALGQEGTYASSDPSHSFGIMANGSGLTLLPELQTQEQCGSEDGNTVCNGKEYGVWALGRSQHVCNSGAGQIISSVQDVPVSSVPKPTELHGSGSMEHSVMVECVVPNSSGYSSRCVEHCVESYARSDVGHVGSITSAIEPNHGRLVNSVIGSRGKAKAQLAQLSISFQLPKETSPSSSSFNAKPVYTQQHIASSSSNSSSTKSSACSSKIFPSALHSNHLSISISLIDRFVTSGKSSTIRALQVIKDLFSSSESLSLSSDLGLHSTGHLLPIDFENAMANFQNQNFETDFDMSHFTAEDINQFMQPELPTSNPMDMGTYNPFGPPEEMFNIGQPFAFDTNAPLDQGLSADPQSLSVRAQDHINTMQQPQHLSSGPTQRLHVSPGRNAMGFHPEITLESADKQLAAVQHYQHPMKCQGEMMKSMLDFGPSSDKLTGHTMSHVDLPHDQSVAFQQYQPLSAYQIETMHPTAQPVPAYGPIEALDDTTTLPFAQLDPTQWHATIPEDMSIHQQQGNALESIKFPCAATKATFVKMLSNKEDTTSFIRDLLYKYQTASKHCDELLEAAAHREEKLTATIKQLTEFSSKFKTLSENHEAFQKAAAPFLLAKPGETECAALRLRNKMRAFSYHAKQSHAYQQRILEENTRLKAQLSTYNEVIRNIPAEHLLQQTDRQVLASHGVAICPPTSDISHNFIQHTPTRPIAVPPPAFPTANPQQPIIQAQSSPPAARVLSAPTANHLDIIDLTKPDDPPVVATGLITPDMSRNSSLDSSNPSTLANAIKRKQPHDAATLQERAEKRQRGDQMNIYQTLATPDVEAIRPDVQQEDFSDIRLFHMLNAQLSGDQEHECQQTGESQAQQRGLEQQRLEEEQRQAEQARLFQEHQENERRSQEASLAENNRRRAEETRRMCEADDSLPAREQQRPSTYAEAQAKLNRMQEAAGANIVAERAIGRRRAAEARKIDSLVQEAKDRLAREAKEKAERERAARLRRIEEEKAELKAKKQALRKAQREKIAARNAVEKAEKAEANRKQKAREAEMVKARKQYEKGEDAQIKRIKKQLARFERAGTSAKTLTNATDLSPEIVARLESRNKHEISKRRQQRRAVHGDESSTEASDDETAEVGTRAAAHPRDAFDDALDEAWEQLDDEAGENRAGDDGLDYLFNDAEEDQVQPNGAGENQAEGDGLDHLFNDDGQEKTQATNGYESSEISEEE